MERCFPNLCAVARSANPLQILRSQTGFLSDLGEKPAANLFVIVEREGVVGPTLSVQPAVRSVLPDHRLSDSE